MRRVRGASLIVLLSLMGGGAWGEPIMDAPGAELRGLDKMANATSDLSVRDGATQAFGELQVSVSDCRFPQDSPATDAWAHLTISTQKGKTLFSGWMSAASPALSAMDDPRYDVWLVRCISN